MARFEQGTFVEVIETGRVGIVTGRKRTKVTVCFYDKSFLDPEEIIFQDYQLKVVELPGVKTSQLKPFVRGELSLEEMTNGTRLYPEAVQMDSKAYRITVEDLLVGLTVYEDEPLENIYAWVDTIIMLEEHVGFPDGDWEDLMGNNREEAILAYTKDNLYDIHWGILDDWDGDSYEGIVMLKADLEMWVESKGTKIPEDMVLTFAEAYDCDSIDKQDTETQELFKECLDYSADVKKDPKAIQRRGYCYYCGTKVYPNDWMKARDAFLEYYKMTGDASAANTLGYIFYYGRCNGGVPEYEKAFKYFSIGHARTIFESTYKLADMLAHGYGVVKDGTSANYLYWGVYEQCLERFQMGDTRNKFPDAALRVGKCYRDGIGVKEDLETAYFYYLQADYAIRERISRENYYGDTVVFNGVQKALAETRKKYTKHGRKMEMDYPGWTKWTLIDHRRCMLTIKEGKDGVLILNAMPMKRRDEREAPQMLITVPKADYCELKKKIRLTTAPGSVYEIMNGFGEIVFDSVSFDWGKKTTNFYLYDELVGKIQTEKYIFTAPAKKIVKPSGEKYHFVSVRFEGTGRCYDYLCDDMTVAVGDRVVINGYDGEKSVEVVAVFDKYESELGLPLERYKKVLRKVFPE